MDEWLDLLNGMSIRLSKAVQILKARRKIRLAKAEHAALLVKEMDKEGYSTGIAKPRNWIYEVVVFGKK
jgi:hypothetical protein